MRVPNVGKYLINSFQAKNSPVNVIKGIESISWREKEDIPEDKIFVIDKNEDNSYKLFYADYLREHPKGKIIPKVDITVKDNEDSTGSVIGYKLDLEPNLVSVTTVIMMAIAFCCALVWWTLSIFVEFDFIGLVVSSVILVGTVCFFIQTQVNPWVKMMRTIKDIAMRGPHFAGLEK